MGTNITLPELDVTKPAQNPAPNPLQEFQRAEEIKSQIGQQAIQQQQATALSQQNQMQAMQLKDMQTLRDLAPKYVQKDSDGNLKGFDTEGYFNAALGSAVNPQTVNALRNQYYESIKNAAGATKAQRDNELAQNGEMYDIGEEMRGLLKKNPSASAPTPAATPGALQPGAPQPGAQPANASGMPSYLLPNAAAPGPPGQVAPPTPAAAPQPSMSQVQATPEMMAAWHAALPKLLRLNPQAAGQLNPNQFPSEAQIDQMQAGLGVHAKALEEAETLAKTQEAAGKGAVDNAEAGLKQIQLNLAKNSTPGSFDQQIDGIYPPNNAQNAGMNAMLKGQINASLSRGDVDTAKKFIASALDTVQSMNKEKAMATDPAIQQAKLQLSTAQKVAEQAISDGDPKAAAKLLIDGTVAPSQIISSRKPAFAQQAFTAAEQMQPGWSATKADADYNVAKSPENIRFFGSAKSLTDPGGTLDQLAAAAKDIPANQIPVFNSVADAVKASTGSGPIAKYAALALGVADDYSKVMGGGQGSDTSRTQALNLVASKQSPEQRAASIEGIRGAVGSQTTSRVGNNPVLQKMYGSNLPKQNSPAPTGKSVSLAAARQLPQNQGKSDAEITKDIEQYGHTVVP